MWRRVLEHGLKRVAVFAVGFKYMQICEGFQNIGLKSVAVPSVGFNYMGI